MPRSARLVLAVGLVLLSAVPLPAQDVAPTVTARDLLLPCQEADNDPRDGYLAQLECVQFIRGFAAGLEAAGQSLCLPEANRDDTLRRGFVRWVHASFSKRSREPVGAALYRMLKMEFPCD